jgi:hypothetical protein
MRTTQGQAAFGQNVQSIITYSYMVKQQCNRCRWTRLFNARVTRLLQSSNTHKLICYELLLSFTNYSGKAEPQCQATSIEVGSPPATICAGFVDICIPILHSYRPPSLLPDACHAWGGCGWHKHTPKHSKHHRQRDASLTAKLDLAPSLSQLPSHAYSVQCLSKPASCAFLLACFPKNQTPVPAA